MKSEKRARRRVCAEGDGAPHALTIFLSVGERREVVRALRVLHTDRATALRIALGLEVSARRVNNEGGASDV